MKLGNYQAIINEKHNIGIAPVTHEKARELEQKVDELTGILGDNIPWALGGGLAIALTIGKFYRVNSDADILVDSKNLDRLAEQARAKGYELFLRLADIKLSPRKNLYVYQEATEEIARKADYRHLKLIKVDEQGRAKDDDRDILGSIEVLSNTQIDESTVLTEKRFLFTSEKMFQSGYKTISGRPLILSSLDYLIKIKEFFIEKKGNNPRPKDVLDLRLLNEFAAQKTAGRLT